MKKTGIFDQLLSLTDAAKSIGVTPDYLRQEIKRGKLIVGVDCQKYGKQWIVLAENFYKKYENTKEKKGKGEGNGEIRDREDKQ